MMLMDAHQHEMKQYKYIFFLDTENSEEKEETRMMKIMMIATLIVFMEW